MLREEAIKRIMERDGKTRAEAEKRIDSQITNSQRAQARQDSIAFSPNSVQYAPGDPDPDPNWIRILSGQWIRIQIQEGKITHKSRKK